MGNSAGKDLITACNGMTPMRSSWNTPRTVKL